MKKERRGKAGRIILTIFVCITIIGVMAVGTFFCLQKMGEKKLVKNATSELPSMERIKVVEADDDTKVELNVSTEDELAPGEILYNGKKYEYNKDILSFVVMGVDSREDIGRLLDNKTGSQADFIFVVVADKRNKELKLIGINRNTMTDVWVCDDAYNYYDTRFMQITLQHAYGTGGVDSCERTVAAVDNILYTVPIHGYFAMNMSAITKLNDAVGGVELVATEDVPHSDIKKGDKITLKGEQAYEYLHNREWGKDSTGTSDDRLVRQKQYLNKFVPKLLEMSKKDLSVPVELYKIIENYSVTNITLDEVTYLLSQAVDFKFNIGTIYTLPGKTEYNPNTDYDEYYIDEDALYKMVVEIFYEPVV